MKTFEESGWQFQFEDHWEVLPYDKHRYYRYLSGYGLKGIDFLAWSHAAQRLFLLEVKNFAPQEWNGPSPNMALVLEDPAAYADEMIEKFEDSLRLFQIIHQYLARKWWYRSYWKFRGQWAPAWLKARLPLSIWERAYRLSQGQVEKLCLCLWIQLAEEVSPAQATTFLQQLEEIMSQKLASQGYAFLLATPQHPINGIQIKLAA